MNRVGRFGFRFFRQIKSLSAFFRFVGHMAVCCHLAFKRHEGFTYNNLAIVLHRSGVKMARPLVVFFFFFCYLVVSNSHDLMDKYNIRHQVIVSFQATMARELLPAMIAIFLCIHASLDTINRKVTKIKHAPHDALLRHSLPTLIGMPISAFFLYFYCLLACFSGVFIALLQHDHITVREYLVLVNSSVHFLELLMFLLRGFLFASIAGMIVAYYHYQIASQHLSLRVCVSRIITRGIFWVVVASFVIGMLTQ